MQELNISQQPGTNGHSPENENITVLSSEQSAALEEEYITVEEEKPDLWKQSKLMETLVMLAEWAFVLVILFITFPSMLAFTMRYMNDYFIFNVSGVVIALFVEGGAALWGLLLTQGKNTQWRMLICAIMTVYSATTVAVVSFFMLIRGVMTPATATVLSIMIVICILATLIFGFINHFLKPKTVANLHITATTGQSPYLTVIDHRRITEEPQKQLAEHIQTSMSTSRSYSVKQVNEWRQTLLTLTSQNPGIGERKLLKLTDGKIPTYFIRKALAEQKGGK
jgi:hypothetical protein